jgi:hypothetical protein
MHSIKKKKTENNVWFLKGPFCKGGVQRRKDYTGPTGMILRGGGKKDDEIKYRMNKNGYCLIRAVISLINCADGIHPSREPIFLTLFFLIPVGSLGIPALG